MQEIMHNGTFWSVRSGVRDYKLNKEHYRVEYKYIIIPDTTLRCLHNEKCGEPVHEAYIKQLISIQQIIRVGTPKHNLVGNEDVRACIMAVLKKYFKSEQDSSLVTRLCQKHHGEFCCTHS